MKTLNDIAKSLVNDDDRLYEGFGFDKSLNLATEKHVRCLCPNCEDSRSHKGHKDCSVDREKGLWHCFHCGAGGYIPTKREYMRLNSKQRAIENRRRSAPKEEEEYQRPEWVPEFMVGNVALNPNADQQLVLDYLTQTRHLSLEVLQRAKVSIPNQETKDHRLRPVIQFNFWDRSVLINWKQRSLDKGMFSFKGGKQIPYRLDAIVHKDICYITEGEIDTLSMMEAGYPETISVPNGGSSHLGWLDEIYETHFSDKKVVVIAGDFDNVGSEMMKEVVRRMGAERCYIVVWDEDCKDANEELCKYGVEGVRRCVEDAVPAPVGGISTAKSQLVEANLDNLITYGLSPGYHMGLRAADEKFRFEPGRFVVVTGLPGDGKSELVDEFVLRLALLHGWKAAYFSPENTPLELHIAKLVSKLTGYEFKLKGSLTPGLYEGCKKWLSQNIYHIMPETRHSHDDAPAPLNHREMISQAFSEPFKRKDSDNFYLDEVLDVARNAVQCLGVRQVIIDPFNSIDRDPDHRGLSDKDWALHVCNACRNFAAHYDCLVYLVAHPRKMDRAKLDGRKRRVEMNDISGSSDFGNKCDYCIVVDRNDEAEVVTVYVDKVKFKQNGSRSKFTLHYDMLSGRYAGCTLRVSKSASSPSAEPEISYSKDIDWLYFNQRWVNEQGEVTIRTYLHS